MFDAVDFDHISDLDDRRGTDYDLGKDDEAVAKVENKGSRGGKGAYARHTWRTVSVDKPKVDHERVMKNIGM